MKLWFLLILGALGMALTGCPSPPNPSPTTNPTDLAHDMLLTSVWDAGADGGIPACPKTVTETQANICPDLFTEDNHICVICQGGTGCIDHSVEVYCTTGPCALDANCQRRGQPNLSKRPGKKRIVK